MVKSLRKRHLQIWSMLLVLLPVSIISARLATPVPAKDKLLQPAETPAYSTVVKTIEKDNYTIRLRKENDSSFQLEWINKAVLTVPTATVYKVPAGSKNIKEGLLIGRIEARGVYRFPLDKSFQVPGADNYELLLYDFIHQQVIDSIHF